MRCRIAFIAVCCSLLVVAQHCEAQGNLVPNPSFEQQDTCTYITGFLGISKPLDWENWFQSPDYFDACAGAGGGLDTLLDVPLNGFSYQHALDGDAYIGVCAYGYVTWLPEGSYREHAGCQLLQPMEVGETYELSFHTNVAAFGNPWPMKWACDNMGMLFTTQPNIWSDVDQPLFALRNYAHLHSTAIISDTANWTLVSGNFVADSAYQYLVLGNFFSNAFTDTLHLGGGTSLGAYYFVDDVCVVKAGQQCDSGEGIGDLEPVSTLVWPNPTAEVLTVAGVTKGELWQVFDLGGRIIHNGTALGEQLEIHASHWLPGEYVLQIGTDRRRHVRFVVMR